MGVGAQQGSSRTLLRYFPGNGASPASLDLGTVERCPAPFPGVSRRRGVCVGMVCCYIAAGARAVLDSASTGTLAADPAAWSLDFAALILPFFFLFTSSCLRYLLTYLPS